MSDKPRRVDRHRRMPRPPRQYTLADLFGDFRCTRRERLALIAHLHRFRHEKALKRLMLHDMQLGDYHG